MALECGGNGDMLYLALAIHEPETSMIVQRSECIQLVSKIIN
jgi:hypothetical protein